MNENFVRLVLFDMFAPFSALVPSKRKISFSAERARTTIAPKLRNKRFFPAFFSCHCIIRALDRRNENPGTEKKKSTITLIAFILRLRAHKVENKAQRVFPSVKKTRGKNVLLS